MKKIFNIIIISLAIVAMNSCEDKNARVEGGTPVVRYVRPCDAEKSDSLLYGAYLGNRIAIIGEGLAGVNKIYFNDQKAILNPTLVTENSIIVTIPNTIPSVKLDLMKLYTSTDSCIYEFEVKVPAPAVNSMFNEYTAEGETTTISGMYFVDDETSPLTVTFNEGNLEATIVSATLTEIVVEIPAGAQAGAVAVSSVYGKTISSFWYKDNRNIILDFNNGNYPDYDYFFGWHGANGVASEGGVNGNYLIMSGAEMTDNAYQDGKFGFEKWTYLPDDPDFFDVAKINDYVLKFEAKYSDWSAAALQIIFTGAEDVMLNWQNGNGLTSKIWKDNKGDDNAAANGYIGDPSYPRILWNPWINTGIYESDGWLTVTIPMSECKYNVVGSAVSPQGAGHYSGITLFVNQGYQYSTDKPVGTPCNPVIWLDNVRIVKK